MGHRHSREEILAAATDVTLEHGFEALTYRAVAERMGIPDRTVVYYFPSKPDLLRAVGQDLIARMSTELFGALGDDRRPTDDLLRLAWPTVRSSRADPYAALAFEIVGLAGAGRPPFPELAQDMSQRFVEWLSDRVDSTADHRAAGAAVLGRLLGLLLIHRIAGEPLADAAARYEGITPPT
jgi:AcrR family transcriptional regulator